MNISKFFSELNKYNTVDAGGKGASLGELSKAGFNVPNGFVILTEVFDDFLEMSDLTDVIETIIEDIDFSNSESCFLASQDIIMKIMAKDISSEIKDFIFGQFDLLENSLVAVRSSATSEDSIDAAWAGQLDTFLSVNRENLISSIKKCWSSLFTERALSYRKEKSSITRKISVAVIVQNMVDSEMSGTSFSINPFNANTNELIIDAGFGLGEAIVSGQVTPESYLIDKENLRILGVTESDQERGLFQKINGGTEWRSILEKKRDRILSINQVIELGKIIVDIENHYGFPCDIEWAFSNNSFYILQSRPVTSVSRSDIEIQKYLQSVKDLKQVGRWSQPPLTSGFYVKWTCSEFIKSFIPDIKLHPISFIDGYAYVDKNDQQAYLDYLINLYYEGSLKGFSQRLDYAGSILHTVHGKFIKISDDEKYSSLEKMIFSHFEYQSFWNFEAIVGDLILELAKRVGYIKTDAELFDKVSPYQKKTWIEDEQDCIIAITKEIPLDCNNLREFIDNSEKISELIELYILKYYWIETDRWLGKSLTKEKVIAKVIEDFINHKENNHFDLYNNKIDLENADPIIHLSVVTAYWRATCAGLTMQITNEFQKPLQKLADLVNLTFEDIIFLHHDELIQLINTKQLPVKKDILQNRNEEFFIYQNSENCLQILASSNSDYYLIKSKLLPSETDAIDVFELKGIGASGGHVTGPVRIVFSRDQFKDFSEGDILVAPETTPAFVPLMRKAAAIVTDRGGITSHAAIVGRELKKPVIISVKGATRILINGQKIDVDAYNGIIRILR